MLPKLFLGNFSQRLLGWKLTNWIAQFAIARWMRRPAAWVASKVAEKAVDRTLTRPSPGRLSRSPGTQERVIWQVWLQGWESAPDIVKAIQEYNSAALPGFTFRRLSAEDALGLVDISSKVLDHFNAGRISQAGFADLLRLRLVSTYGGIWADSTILFSAGFSEFHQVNKNFVLQWDYDINRMKSWNFTIRNGLFSAERNDSFIQLWGDALEAMWEKSGQIEYFDAFYVATVLQKRGENPNSDLQQAQSHDLNKVLPSVFSLFLQAETVDEAKALLGSYPFHKFSYKTDPLENQRAADLIRACAKCHNAEV